MSRLQLFEFEDLSWFPSFLRNYGTDFLQFLSNKTKMYKPIIPFLTEALKETKQETIVDLASGGGGGLIWLNNELLKEHPSLKIILTDYFPNISAFEHTKKQANNFEYVAESIDARNVPDNLKGLRTQFLSLHHFKPEDAIQILQNAVNSKNGIALIEAQERSITSFIGVFLSPFTVIFTTPFIKPFNIGRIIFTYLIPVVPLFVWWDGIASVLRTYSIKEMNELVSQLDNKDSFNWKIGKVKSGPAVIQYLIGTPKI
jgi:hypothetical protein